LTAQPGNVYPVHTQWASVEGHTSLTHRSSHQAHTTYTVTTKRKETAHTKSLPHDISHNGWINGWMDGWITPGTMHTMLTTCSRRAMQKGTGSWEWSPNETGVEWSPVMTSVKTARRPPPCNGPAAAALGRASGRSASHSRLTICPSIRSTASWNRTCDQQKNTRTFAELLFLICCFSSLLHPDSI
jgi:hypothetical protein